jgi:hypothetical protein
VVVQGRPRLAGERHDPARAVPVISAQAQASLAFTATSLLEVLPYLLASILVAAYAQASGA